MERALVASGLHNFMDWLFHVAYPCPTLCNLRHETCFLLNFYIVVYLDFTEDLSIKGRFYNHNNVDDLKLNFRLIWNYKSRDLEYLLMTSVPLFTLDSSPLTESSPLPASCPFLICFLPPTPYCGGDTTLSSRLLHQTIHLSPWP